MRNAGAVGPFTRRWILAAAAAACIPARAQAAAADDAELRRQMAFRIAVQKRATGIVLGIADRASARVFAEGSAARQGAPVSGTTAFPIASLTKVVTGLLLADAVRRGELGLDDPIDEHLPPGATAPAFERRRITLLDLATHTSGLPLRPPNLGDTDPLDPYAGYSEEQLYAAISGFRLERAPGAAFGYSNFAYGLLGHAVARRAGAPFRELVQARVLRPLGMAYTGFDRPTGLAQGHNLDLQPVPPWRFGALDPAGGLFSTVADLTRLLDLFRGRRDRPLSRAAADMLVPRRPGDDDHTRMAVAWRVRQGPEGPCFWSNGSAGGFRAYMGVDPSRRLGVVGFANAQTPVGVDDIAGHVLDPRTKVDMTTPVVRRAISLPAEALARFVGAYEYAPGDQVVVRLDGEALVASIGGAEAPIFPESDHSFFLKVVDAQVVFAADGAYLDWVQGGETFRYRRVN